jgi:hypothetical protein
LHPIPRSLEKEQVQVYGHAGADVKWQGRRAA